MTRYPNVCDSAAFPLFITLQEQGFEFQVTGGALFIKPVDRVTPDLRVKLRQHKPALITLVRVCDQGVQDRVTVFRAQLEFISDLPIPMANIPPKNAIHSGRPGGSVSASRMAVTIALPSATVLSRQAPRPPSSHSVDTAPRTVKTMISSPLMPKKYTPASMTGIRL